MALYAILRALGVGRGDEVILPGYTCVMNVNPVKYLGAKPVYVDIEPVTFNMRIGLLEEKISRGTKAIIVQHTYGYPCEMDSIMSIAKKKNIPVVEDCCLALGSEYKGKRCSTFGLAAYWSFQWNKPFTTGIGGMATTNDRPLGEKIEALRVESMYEPSKKSALMLGAQRLIHGMLIYPRTTALATSIFRWMTHKDVVIGSSSRCEFEPRMEEDFFMGMSAGQCRAGLRQMKRIDANLAHRKSMAKTYNLLFKAAGWKTNLVPEYIDPVLVRYPVRVNNKAAIVAEAPRHGVDVGTWFECPLHPKETPMSLYDYEVGMCPEAEKACETVINLPVHQRTTIKTARRAVDFITKNCLPG